MGNYKNNDGYNPNNPITDQEIEQHIEKKLEQFQEEWNDIVNEKIKPIYGAIEPGSLVKAKATIVPEAYFHDLGSIKIKKGDILFYVGFLQDEYGDWWPRWSFGEKIYNMYIPLDQLEIISGEYNHELYEKYLKTKSENSVGGAKNDDDGYEEYKKSKKENRFCCHQQSSKEELIQELIDSIHKKPNNNNNSSSEGLEEEDHENYNDVYNDLKKAYNETSGKNLLCDPENPDKKFSLKPDDNFFEKSLSKKEIEELLKRVKSNSNSDKE